MRRISGHQFLNKERNRIFSRCIHEAVAKWKHSGSNSLGEVLEWKCRTNEPSRDLLFFLSLLFYHSYLFLCFFILIFFIKVIFTCINTQFYEYTYAYRICIWERLIWFELRLLFPKALFVWTRMRLIPAGIIRPNSIQLDQKTMFVLDRSGTKMDPIRLFLLRIRPVSFLTTTGLEWNPISIINQPDSLLKVHLVP